jgi:hypothetical protein
VQRYDRSTSVYRRRANPCRRLQAWALVVPDIAFQPGSAFVAHHSVALASPSLVGGGADKRLMVACQKAWCAMPARQEPIAFRQQPPQRVEEGGDIARWGDSQSVATPLYEAAERPWRRLRTRGGLRPCMSGYSLWVLCPQPNHAVNRTGSNEDGCSRAVVTPGRAIPRERPDCRVPIDRHYRLFHSLTVRQTPSWQGIEFAGGA